MEGTQDGLKLIREAGLFDWIVLVCFDGVDGVSRPVRRVWNVYVCTLHFVLVEDFVCERFLSHTDGHVAVCRSVAFKLNAEEVSDLTVEGDFRHVFCEFLLES